MEGAAGQLDAFDIVVSGAAGNVLTPALDILVKSVVDIGLLGTFNVFIGCHDLLNAPRRLADRHRRRSRHGASGWKLSG